MRGLRHSHGHQGATSAREDSREVEPADKFDSKELEDFAEKAARKVPKYLYKYKSLAGPGRAHVRDLIVNQSLYFPGPSDLNDPFEAKPYLLTRATVEQQKKYVAGMVKRTQSDKPRAERRRISRVIGADWPRFRETISNSTNATLQAAGIYSLSARHLDLLMWPHYADNHRGVCVRFDMQALLDAEHVPFPVSYADQRPECDTVLEPTTEWLNKALLTKGRPWRYEEEWRLVRNRGARKIVRLRAPTVNGVLLGANISSFDRAEILKWIEECDRPVGVAQTRFHSSAYALELDQI